MEIKEDTEGTAFRESMFTDDLYHSYGLINARENFQLDKQMVLYKQFCMPDNIRTINIIYVHDLNETLTEPKIELY